VVKEVASLGTVTIGALLFLTFLTTLRPVAIAAVRGDKVIDARVNEAATLARSEAPHEQEPGPRRQAAISSVSLNSRSTGLQWW
jgi:hypothetical protein